MQSLKINQKIKINIPPSHLFDIILNTIMIQIKEKLAKQRAISHFGSYSLKQICINQYSNDKILLGENLQTKQIMSVKIMNKYQLSLTQEINKKMKDSFNYQRIAMAVSLISSEADKWRNLEHRNLLKFYDVIQTQEQLIYLNQFCQGQQLQEYLRSLHQLFSKRQSNRLIESLEMLRQLTDSVLHFHQNGVFHLNISPKNINSSVFQPRIYKLGYPFIEGIKNQLYQNQHIYKSPELIQKKKVTDKSDVWSLGVIFYQSIFKCLPWDPIVEFSNRVFQIQDTKNFKLPKKTNVSPSICYLLQDMLCYEESQRISLQNLRLDILKMYPLFSKMK